MPEILITEGVRIHGEPREVGEIASLSDADARVLLASGRGVLVEPAPEPVEPSEPAPEPKPAPPAGRRTQTKPVPQED